MKKSEFWTMCYETLGCGQHGSDGANRLVAAAERKGQIWDPEEEPLPERLEVTPNKAYLRIVTPERDQSFVAIINGAGRWDSCFAPKKQCLTILAEAVRRYNLFPRIVAVLSQDKRLYGEMVAEALRIAEEEG